MQLYWDPSCFGLHSAGTIQQGDIIILKAAKARWKRRGITPRAAKCKTQKAQHHLTAANQVFLIAGVVHGTSWELEKVRGNGVMAMLTLAIISVVAALQVFGKDRLIFWRESESGESCCSYLPAQASGTSAYFCRLLVPVCSNVA